MSYSSINRVVLVGRLTRDPRLAALPSGAAVCDLRVACDSARKVGEGQYERKPSFFSVHVYGAQAEIVARHMAKGRRLAIDGRLDWHEWESADGVRREAVEILADRVEFLDRPGGDGSGGLAADDEDGDGLSLASEGDGEGEDGALAADAEREGDLVF
jgi:single-strand DNA-binding protein